MFIFLHPKSVDTSKVYLSPFSSIVWYSITFIIIVISCVLRQTFLTENQICVHGIDENENESTYSNSFLLVFGFLVQQGKCLVLCRPHIKINSIGIFYVQRILDVPCCFHHVS